MNKALVFFVLISCFFPELLVATPDDLEKPEYTTVRRLEVEGWKVLSGNFLRAKKQPDGKILEEWQVIVFKELLNHSGYCNVAEKILQREFSLEPFNQLKTPPRGLRRSRQFK